MAMGNLDSGVDSSVQPSGTADQETSPRDADSDWEYEYDQDETEDFYFTLDLTTHVPDVLTTKQYPRKGHMKAREANGGKGIAHDERSSATLVRPSVPGPLQTEKYGRRREAGELQVLDLHTNNPFVKFDEDVYSCSWMTDLGTQFYVSRPGVTEHPLRPGNVLDVIAMSQTRLVGKPVTLRPLNDPALQNTEGASSTNAIEIGDGVSSDYDQTPGPSDFSTLRPGEPLVIPRDRVKDQAAEDQASFLERLSAIKLKKGENDIVPVSGVKYYEPPANKDDIREKALAVAAEKAVTEQLEQARRPSQPVPPWQTLKRRKRNYADQGKETKANRARRLAQEEPERPPRPAILLPRSQQSITITSGITEPPPGPALLLPRSQQSITATPGSWGSPILPQPAYSTVQYDAPSWDVPDESSNTALPGSYYSGAYNHGFDGTFDQRPELVGSSYSITDRPSHPHDSSGEVSQPDGDRMEISETNGDASQPPSSGQEN